MILLLRIRMGAGTNKLSPAFRDAYILIKIRVKLRWGGTNWETILCRSRVSGKKAAFSDVSRERRPESSAPG